MNTMSTSPYYMIIFLRNQDKGLNPVHIVPASWIRWQNEKVETVIVAYPEEHWKVTMERVKRYENPQQKWNSFLARIEGSSSNYSSMIASINERERVEEPFISGLVTPQPGPSHSSAPPNSGAPVGITEVEFKRWVSGLRSSVNQNPFRISTMKGLTMLQNLILKIEQEIEIERNRSNEDSEIPPGNSGQSSRFTELIPNSGVYIETSELEICLMSSRNCFQLARLLMKHFFSTTTLKNALGLEERAITAITDFVSQQGCKENWRQSSRKSIESALRNQLQWLKKNNK